MAVVRKNILKDTTARDDFIEAVHRLKEKMSNRTTRGYGIPGPDQQLSLYDLFVIEHIQATRRAIPSNGSWLLRNTAHRSPSFLPWHRWFLLRVEGQMRSVLGKSGFALPYWDWQTDADAGVPERAAVWGDTYMGHAGIPVNSGPFRAQNNPRPFWVIVEADGLGAWDSVRRGLERQFYQSANSLPNSTNVKEVLSSYPTYDSVGFDVNSAGFRNRLEGFLPAGQSSMHNRVHDWIGRDMIPISSPNDPVFFLHHCNVDRIWESWMSKNGRSYLPGMDAPPVYSGIRIDDVLPFDGYPVDDPPTPRRALDMTSLYSYDQLVPI
ncbi:tyrosinase family protein [Kitasatospora sp. NPDC096077]|uniref:tyrosinase family protein n=1 Tax=Kitasatospora sp. NPDC096077 TaxID=3155544 RepID=UPI003318E023